MDELARRVHEATDYVKSKISIEPSIAIILGTGLNDLTNYIEVSNEIAYDEIPYCPVSTVDFHHGKLLVGRLAGKNIVAMHGRFHYYEGYDIQDVTFLVRVMRLCGANILIVSNACGSLTQYIPKGSIMIIDDYINLLGTNPLIGYNKEIFGPRFVEMSEPYSRRLIELTEKIALEEKIKVYRGVYAAVPGPTLETRAEAKYIRLIGADVVGMSTIPETIVARQMGMEVLGFSVVTDEVFPIPMPSINVQEILETAAKADKVLSKLIYKIVEVI
ncbi:purine-nucleoside phosphorylase [Bacteroidetes/Chlorobi group bacterium MS-B_bin-24]|nr:MAG: purine-nucleoside phosphorylase [Bacteroidetes/Chlorobi group bacterium MS-B_bin-24]